MSLRTVKYRQDIQALRGLSILAVLIFHAWPTIFPQGYLGVDVFFVISGFVVTPLMLRAVQAAKSKREVFKNLRSFYLRRFYRLAPALALALVASTLLIFLFGVTKEHSRFAGLGISTLLLLGNVGAVKFSGDYFAENANPLVHMWSLSVEEQIYIFLPLLFVLLPAKLMRRKTATLFVLILVTAIGLLFFLFPNFLQPLYLRLHIYSGSYFNFYSPLSRMWEFVLGGIAFLIFNRLARRDLRISRFLEKIALLSVFSLLLLPMHLSMTIAAPLTTLAVGLVLLYSSLAKLPKRLLVTLEWLGDRSYSIYLIHLPLIYVAHYSPLFGERDTDLRKVLTAMAVAASIIFGSISYSKVENKFRLRGVELGKYQGTHFRFAALAMGIPMILLIAMYVGAENRYWGLDQTPKTPVYAGSLDPNCKRQTASGPACFYNIPGAKKTVLLIGDSHAGQFSQAVVDAARTTGWNAVTYAHGGCQVQFAVSKRKEISSECLELNLKILDWIRINKPTSIIVSEYVQDVSNIVEIRRSLKVLNELVPHTLLVSNTPIFPDGDDYLVSRPLIMRPYDTPKSFPLEEMVTLYRTTTDELAQWAKDHGLQNLRPDSLFCDGVKCTRWSPQGWLYRDADHLSALGADRAVPLFENYLLSVA